MSHIIAIVCNIIIGNYHKFYVKNATPNVTYKIVLLVRRVVSWSIHNIRFELFVHFTVERISHFFELFI